MIHLCGKGQNATLPNVELRLNLTRIRSSLLTWTAIAVSSFVLLGISPFAIAAFLAYAIMLPAKDRRPYALSWASFAVCVYVFNVLRSIIYDDIQANGRHVFSSYAILGDRALLHGHVAPELLQQWSVRWLDWIALGFHFSHFVFFVPFTVAAWWSDRTYALWSQRALLVVFGVGEAIYYLLPTVPPWLAFEQGLLPPIRHTTRILYAQLMTDGAIRLVDTNPVAAMPSLHVAIPVACAVIGWSAFRRPIAATISCYAALQCLAVMYLGEHYLVDVIAGALLGFLATTVTRGRVGMQREPSVS